MTDLILNKTCNSKILALIWLAMQYEMNILISGGTASGKTSFLNVLMPFIPPNHRIVSIEDTRELQLPRFLYWCPLTVRQPNESSS
jgi:flagellar protein FlaI